MEQQETKPLIVLFTIGRTLSTAVERSVRQLNRGYVLHEPYYLPAIPKERQTNFQSFVEKKRRKFREFTNSLAEEDLDAYDFVFAKECASLMAPHFDEFLHPFWKGFKAVILIRHPFKIMASAYKALGDDKDYIELFSCSYVNEFYRFIETHFHYEPVIFDADDLERDPRATMKAFCQAAGLVFEEKMLRWEKTEEKCATRCLFHSHLEKTTGFIAKEPSLIEEKRNIESIKDYPDWLVQMMEDDLPNYFELYNKRIII